MKSKATIIEQITVKRDRLALYLKREAEMLDGGVQRPRKAVGVVPRDW